jgi:hypothetical protein
VKAEQSNRRLGPVCLSTPICSALFGVIAIVLQGFFPAELDRVILASGVIIGATVGFGLGVAWEANLLPRNQITQGWRVIWPYTWRCLIGLLVLVLACIGFHLFERYQAKQIAATILQAGGWRLGDSHSLQFVGTRISDANLAYVRALDDTEFLELHGTSVRGPGLANISEWKSLRELFISNNPIGDEGLVHLKGLYNLEWLEMAETRISDAGLLHLRGTNKLQRLSLVLTSISDAGLRHLKSLKALRHLDLLGTHVSSDGVKDLQRTLPNCQIVWGDLAAPKGGDGEFLEVVRGAE